MAAVIEGRMTSSRLPGKVMMKLGELPAFQHLVNRLRAVPEISQIILATTTNSTDDIFVSFAESLGINTYRGSEDDVLGRITRAAENFECEYVVKVTADCPAIDPVIIQKVIKLGVQLKVDFTSNTIVRSYPDGMDCGLITLKALQRAERFAKNPLEREHTSLYIRSNPTLFTTANLLAPPNLTWPDLGLTLDTIEDWNFLNQIFHDLKSVDNFSCSDILELLQSKPGLLEINAQVARRGDT
jgi:spore coat polysaccharide biosynthesis protein SpsF